MRRSAPPSSVLLLALAIAPAAYAAPAADVAVGLMPVEASGAASITEARQATEAMRALFVLVRGVDVIDITRPKKPVPLETLREATATALLVTGVLSGDDSTRELTVTAVDVDGKREVRRSWAAGRREELPTAAEAAGCASLGALSAAEGCQGALAVQLPSNDIEVVVNGAPLGRGDASIVEQALPIGVHRIAVRSGERVGQDRRFHIHYGDTLKLRAADTCGQLYVLDADEQPGCGVTLPTDILSTVPPMPAGTRWAPIITTGVGAVAVAVGAVFAMQARSAAADLATQQRGGASASEIERLQSSSRTNGGLATGFIAGGLVTVGAGVGLFAFNF